MTQLKKIFDTFYVYETSMPDDRIKNLCFMKKYSDIKETDPLRVVRILVREMTYL